MPTLSKKTIRRVLGGALDALRARSDMLLLAAFFAVVAVAGLLFYRFLYAPVFVGQEPAPGNTVLDVKLYQEVINAIDARESVLEEKLRTIPPNPFE